MMKHVFVTACAVAALCGTAIAQTPATKDNNAPAAKPGMTEQRPATPPAANPSKSDSTMDSSKSTMEPSKSATDASKPSGMTAANPQGSVAVTFYTVKPADVQASNLMGATVYNVNNENIGEINDLVIEDGKTLRAVVIGVGGFLGIGERDVAVEPTSLIVTRNNDNDDVRIVLNTTKEDLKNAPAVKFDKESREKAAANESAPASTTGAASSDINTMKKSK
jgi:sporulation protein YlmC with PRC-barrel domain